MSEQQLTTPSDNSLLSLGIDGFSPYNPSPIKLIQTTAATQNVAAGSFFDSETNRAVKYITAVPLMIKDGRAMMPPKENGFVNVKPVCFSRDGINPVNTAQTPGLDKGLGCEKCQHSQWTRIAGKSIRPPCDENKWFTFMDAETRLVHRLLIKGTGNSVIKEFQSAIKKLAQVAASRKQKFVHYEYIVNLTSAFKSKGANRWIELVIGAPAPIDANKYPGLYEDAAAAFEYVKNLVWTDRNQEDSVDSALSNVESSSDESSVPFDIPAVAA